MSNSRIDVRIGPRDGPGIVIGEQRRYRNRDRSGCRKITVTEWRKGVKVEKTKWDCRLRAIRVRRAEVTDLIDSFAS